MASPPFSLSKPKHDLNTFYGRWMHFLKVTNPMNVFILPSQVDAAVDLLDAYKAGTLGPEVTDEQLWAARETKEAVLHPDTNEPILLPLRMSSFAFANVPICTLLMWPNPSTALVIAGQIINQAYNVGVNYANRNASSEQSIQDIAIGFTGATSVGLAVALAGKSLANKYAASMPPVLARLVPYTAVAAAGAAGMVIMRAAELTDGVVLKDGLGNEHGQSVTAGRLAVAKTALSRAVFFPIFPMVLPPLIMDFITRKTSLIAKNPRLAIPVELAVLTSCILVFLPPAIALFPQEESVPASLLEPEFQNKLDANGNIITAYTFNKGL